jgi:protein-L-isoaspartate(D-aspartate) O-methyltransferase
MFGRSHLRIATQDDVQARARAEMIDTQLRRRDIHDPRVLAAMEAIPRHPFVAAEFRDRAYNDEALPSQLGQTISQPYIVAHMTQELRLQPGQRVLEIGTGTGYQTAILACMVSPGGTVFSMERFPALADAARQQLAALHVSNVEIVAGDGSLGWPATDENPLFDRILVTAGAPRLPEPLLAQLADGGILVAPVGDAESQTLTRVLRNGAELQAAPLLACRFVPLVGEHGWK